MRDRTPKYVVKVGEREYWSGRGRSGRESHIIGGTSSVTRCGWWHRGHAMEVEYGLTCERCRTLAPEIASAIDAEVKARKARR